MPAIEEEFFPRMEMNVLPIDVCRLCAQSNDSRSFIPLYTEDKRERIVAKQINQLVANLVSPDDGLPQKICSKCWKNVETCYSFVCDVIETQHRLKRLKRAADYKRKRATDDESTENYRLENVTLNAYDNSLNRRSVSKSRLSLYDKTISNGEECPSVIDIDCEQSSTNINVPHFAANNTPAANSSSLSRQSQSLQPRQQRRYGGESVDAVNTLKKITGTLPPNCLYRCGVCLGKFSTKDECVQHMMSSHTPPSSLFNVDDKNKWATFDVVRKNGPQSVTTTTTIRSTPSRQLSHRHSSSNCNNNNNIMNKTNAHRSILETALSPSFKSRRKILAIDSFYKEIKKTCARFRCDVCGRLMLSWFAFERHLREHRKTDEAEDNAAGTTTKIYLQTSSTAKPLIGYCKICNKLVKHLRRHNMYHTIVKLELDYPDFVKFLSV